MVATIVTISSPIAMAETGYASFYGNGEKLNKHTASGEVFNRNAMTAAHRTLRLGTYVKVTDLKTGKHVIVKINDRGPFIKGRIIDLSKGAAIKLGMFKRGVAKVKVEIVKSPKQKSKRK